MIRTVIMTSKKTSLTKQFQTKKTGTNFFPGEAKNCTQSRPPGVRFLKTSISIIFFFYQKRKVQKNQERETAKLTMKQGTSFAICKNRIKNSWEKQSCTTWNDAPMKWKSKKKLMLVCNEWRSSSRTIDAQKIMTIFHAWRSGPQVFFAGVFSVSTIWIAFFHHRTSLRVATTND